MASEQRQKVRFTGKRTGLEATRVPGHGIVKVGDVIEVSAEQAERWTADVPMRDDKEGSDWAKSGGSYKQSTEKTQEKELKARETLADDIEVDVPLAHPVDPDGDTAEEDAAEASESAKSDK